VVVEIGGAPVRSMEELISALRGHAPGDQVAVIVLRDGERVELTATLAAR
jgi:S1-C subfamily serine protease